MLGKRTENPRPILLAEVRDILEKRSAQPDFGYEQQTSLDYCRKFSKIPLDVAKKLAKELGEFENLHPESLFKIVDILPPHKSTMLAILLKDKSTLTSEEADKAMALIAHARTKIIEEPAVVAPGAVGEPASGELPAAPAAAPAAKAEEKKSAKEDEGEKKKAKADAPEAEKKHKKKESKSD